MTRPVWGTAHLFATVEPAEVESLLDAAWDAGFRSFDTAPSYGFGESEAALGRLLARHTDTEVEITTKVGISPTVRPGRAKLAAKALARHLPAAAQRRLRGERPPGGGAFGVAEVRASLERSLRALPRVDRLLLHEVTPSDITENLLGLLQGYVDRGDVGRLGVATTGDATPDSIARASKVLLSANVSVAPGAAHRPPGVEVFGHGPLGAGGAAVRAVQARRATDAEWARAWDAAVAGLRRQDPADVLLARAAALPSLAGLIIASSRPQRLPHVLEVVSDAEPTPPELAELLSRPI